MVLVGTFNEEDVKNGRDKIAIEQKMNETGLKYINSKIITKNGKPVGIEVYLCDVSEMNLI